MISERFAINQFFLILGNYLGHYEIQNIQFVRQIYCHIGCLS